MAEMTWAQKQTLLRAQALDARIPVIEAHLDSVEPRLPPMMDEFQEEISRALREGSSSGLAALQALSALTSDASSVTDLKEVLDGVIRELIRVHRLVTGELDSPDVGAEPAVPDVDEDVDDYAQPTGAHNAYKPGALIRWDGKIWRNRSTGWLSHSPAEYPAGWEMVRETGGGGGGTPPPDTDAVPAWSALASYAVGDKVTHNGRLWGCLVAHGAEYQGTWAPGVAHTVWADLGAITPSGKAPGKNKPVR